MRENNMWRPLRHDEIDELTRLNCFAENWNDVEVAAEGFNASRLRNVSFSGKIRLGATDGCFELPGGVRCNAGIANVRLHNCLVGNGVYINNIANYIANYDIGDNTFIENVDTIVATLDSTFGQGTEVCVLNETGGREVPIYAGMSAQMAYLIAMFRHDTALIGRLNELIGQKISHLSGLRGQIGRNVRVVNVGEITNTLVGDYAQITGASKLAEGTIAGSEIDPVIIGADVMAEKFVACSGAKITEGAVINSCFIGQACEINHLFSAHDSLFFANCVCENGEAAAIFAGPYTVTMHKSSLLIAGMFSFLNAGSGSNQSNHMYKLGPVHQGVVARGSKTASDSYILWPARIGAFSLVMGRHVNHPDTSELPFSYLIEKYGRSFLVPGVNLKSVGTVRDARKWPQRDKRRDPRLLDRINFNLLSPFTAQKMLAGIRVLHDIETTGGATSDTYTYRGMTIVPGALRKGRDYYTLALDKFMGNSLIHRLRNISGPDMAEIREALRPSTSAGCGPWIDLSGMIAPQQEVEKLCSDIVQGRVSDLDAAETRMTRLANDYYEMEWTWVTEHFAEWFGKVVGELTISDIAEITRRWRSSVVRLDRLLYDDAKKDYSQVSQIGFGVDNTPETAAADFRAVRGEFQDDSFAHMVLEHIEVKSALADDLLSRLGL